MKEGGGGVRVVMGLICIGNNWNVERGKKIKIIQSEVN